MARDDIDLAALGALLGEPARGRILVALSDGRALPASVLAAEAGVARSTASEHLGRLLAGGLVTVERHGRYRYYRLAGPQVAEVLERLATIAPARPTRSLRQQSRAAAIRNGRWCYDHLAGRLGVSLLEALETEGILEGHDGSFRPGLDRLSSRGSHTPYCLTPKGARVLGDFGVRVEPGSRRPLLGHCVDWSEQRHHLAGALGTALAQRFLALGWIEQHRVRRAVRVTEAGWAGLARWFGLHQEALAQARGPTESSLPTPSPPQQAEAPPGQVGAPRAGH